VARTVIVTDDLDGSSPAEPVQFTYDGVNWEIDLSAKNREKLQKALQPFLDKAHPADMAQPKAKTTTPTRTRARTRTRPSRSAKNGREHLDAIRQWAQENGYKVGDRGRIAKSIIEEYELAQKAKR
jgi:nucleoid-associated protein Lsr2